MNVIHEISIGFILFVIIVAALMIWSIPAGQYARVADKATGSIISPRIPRKQRQAADF